MVDFLRFFRTKRSMRANRYYTGSGSCDISISKSHVTIRGAGSGTGGTVIDCANRGRHFAVLGSNVTLAGLRLVNGATPPHDCVAGASVCAQAGDDGGCVFVAHNASAALDRCALAGCTANGRGGAVAARGPVKLNDVVVTDAHAVDQGGGIWAVGTTVLVTGGSSISNCSAFMGGGLSLQGPNATLAGNQFALEGCIAQNMGGGFYAEQGAIVELEAVGFQSNAAGAQGGGMAVVNGVVLAISGNSLLRNNSVSDAPVYLQISLFAHSISVRKCASIACSPG